MDRLGSFSSPYIDEVASSIRSQIMNLHKILEMMESTHRYEDTFIIQTLKETEREIRRLRKFIQA